MLRKVEVYYIRKLKIAKKKIGYDLKLLSFLKMKNQIYKQIRTLSNIHIYSKMMKKKNSCTWTTISIYYNKLQKKLFQNSFI